MEDVDPDTSSEKSGRRPGGAVGTGAQGLCTLPGPARLIQVSEARKVEPGSRAPRRTGFQRPTPRDRAPPPGPLFTDEGPQGPGSQVPKQRGRGQAAVPVSLPPRHILSPRHASGWNLPSGRKVWFSQKDTCAPSYPPRGRRQ